MRQRGQVIVLRTKCGESLLFRYLSGAPVDEARLHSLLVPKIFLLFYFHPTAGMKYYWSRQSCPLSSTISGRQMVYDVMNLLYPSRVRRNSSSVDALPLCIPCKKKSRISLTVFICCTIGKTIKRNNVSKKINWL